MPCTGKPSPTQWLPLLRLMNASFFIPDRPLGVRAAL
jgi:hypothetical protein